MNRKTKDSSQSWIEILLINKAFVIMVVLMIIASVLTKGLFLNGGNINNLAKQISVSTIIGAGFTVLLSSGNLDLSVGSMLSLVGVCYGMMSHHMPLIFALILAIVCGALLGVCNGGISSMLNLNPFVFTLATSQIYKGLAHILCNGKGVSNLGAGVQTIGQKLVFDVIPLPSIIMVAVIIVIAILMKKTVFGRRLLAVGGNRQAARFSGINVRKISVIAFAVAGMCVSIAAIVLTGRVAVALPGAGDGMEMDAIAAVVIGGTPLHGGKANVLGTFFGVILMGTINNMMNLTGVSSFWQWVAKGGIIVAALVLDSVTEAFFSKQRERQQAASGK